MAAILGAALSLSACNSHKTPTAQTKSDETVAQTIVKNCMTKGSLLTKGGRDKILTCIAPPGHEAAFASCAQGSLLHVHSKAAYEQALAVCVQNNR